MNYITTTNLRTQSSQLIHSLKQGDVISLIHRSKVVGLIQPAPVVAKPFDAEQFKHLINRLDLPRTSDVQRKKQYNTHLMKKYGKSVS